MKSNAKRWRANIRPLTPNPFLGHFPHTPAILRGLFAGMFMLWVFTASAAIWYVRQGGTGDGTSWAAASGNLKGIIDAAASGDQIWVATGTYKPTGNTDRTIAFVMKNGVEIFGGFPASGNPNFAQRDWDANPTILSGDINNDGTLSGNSYHIVANIYNGLDQSALLDGFTLTGGNADGSFENAEGGGMKNEASSPHVRNCRFVGNSASEGGGMDNYEALPWVINCLFYNNSASNLGGGIGNSRGSAATIINCTFYGNTAVNSNGGLFCSGSSYPTVVNCILWGNNLDRLHVQSPPNMSYCIVQGGYVGTANLDTDPLFINPATGNFRVLACSPAIDAGNNAALPADLLDDLGAAPRIYNNGTVDIGAYEQQNPSPAPNVYYVKANASGANNGSSWANAFTNLQSAVDAATPCAGATQIWVAAGTYKPTAGTDRSISFAMKNGVAIYGGFAGNEVNLAQRNPALYATVLSGDLSSTGNSYHVVSNTNLNGTAILDGFTITGGLADGTTPEDQGGGMNNRFSSPVLANCIFTGNSAYLGGAMTNYYASPKIDNCKFTDNSAANGGAIINYASTAAITNCVLSNNSASGRGGGIYNEYANPIVTNCLFWGNSASDFGGGMLNSSSPPKITNCTFYNNTSLLGKGITNIDWPAPTVTNCILWGSVTEITNINQVVPEVSYSIVQGGYSGTGNYNLNPLFVNPAAGNFRLQTCSPAIDAGLDANNNTTKDIAGGNRKIEAVAGGQRIDMGAYENQTPVSTGIWHVNAATTTPGTGISWACPMKDLQQALTAASPGDQIWVATGTYKPSVDTDGNSNPDDNRTKAFSMKNGVEILGGFPATGNPGLADRNWAAHVTILSGDIGVAGDNGDNSYHVVFNNRNLLNQTAVLDGFVITGGKAEGAFPTGMGAGMLNRVASPLVRNCTFRDNSAQSFGGGMANLGCVPSVVNCAFTRNSAVTGGGGMLNDRSSPWVTNCTFTGNSSQTGGAMYNDDLANPIVTNCILWGNNGEVDNLNISNPVVAYSIVQGGYAGTGNINADPRFADAANGNLRLQACSPAIDAGSDAANTTTTDLDAKARHYEAIPGGATIDMGAYEYPVAAFAGVWHVNAAAATPGSGISWSCPMKDLQQALAAASAGDKIWVAAGTYKPTAGTDRSISFVMKNGVELLGGFPATGNPGLADRDWDVNPTILSGDIGAAGTSDNSYHVLFFDHVSSSTVVDGFTISGGNGETSQNGGGIYNDGSGVGRQSNPRIINCTITNNEARSGGGLFNDGYKGNSSPTITNCVFSGNKATRDGGAVYNFGGNDGNSSGIFTNVLFSGNKAERIGGGVFNDAVDIVGGVSNPTFVNCSFSGNQANFGVGGMYNDAFTGTCSPIITNCIFWGNVGQIENQNTTPVVTYSIVQGGQLSIDPLFADAANGDFRLLDCSPAIDAGLDANNTQATDLDGNPRQFEAISGGQKIDMGAYEYQQTAPLPTAVCKTFTANLTANTVTVSAADVDNGSSSACGAVVLSINDQPSVSYSCGDVGGYTVTLRAYNAESNRSSTCQTTVTVRDNAKPVLVGCSSDRTLYTQDDGGADCAVVLAYTAPTFSDNCDGTGVATYVSGPVNGTSVNVGGSPYTVEYTYTDAGGNAVLANCRFTVMVVDNTKPTATCPPNTTITAGANCTANLGAYLLASKSDNCTASAGISEMQTPAPTTLLSGHNTAQTVTLTANDGHGNTATCAFIVTLRDMTAPTAICQNITTNLGGDGTAGILADQVLNRSSSFDNCGLVIAQSVAPNAFTCINGGPNTVTLTVHDGNGNTAVCTAIVTVVDNITPTIACPASIIRSTDAGQCAAVVTYTNPTYSDNCSGAGLDHLSGGLSGSTFQKGTTTVVWMATDATNNTQTCSFTITVTDSQAPSITCPANTAKGTDPGQCTAVVVYNNPSYSDNCPGAGLDHVSGGLSGGTFPKGTTTVTWMATDAAGLTKTCTFRIIVSDTQAPTIVCPAAVSVPAAAGQCSAVVAYTTPTATDNCAPAPTVVRIGGTASGGTVVVGGSMAIWRAIDGAGRSSTCSIAISVVDNQAPTIVCPQNIVQNNPANACHAPVFYTAPNATDNCGVNSLYMVSGLASGSSFPVGVTTVTWRANDVNGLSATCSFEVTVTCGAARLGGGGVSLRTGDGAQAWNFALTPNPAHDAVQIAWASEAIAPVRLTVFDTQGRLVWEQTVAEGEQTSRLDVSNWAAGVYLVALNSGGVAVTKRLVVTE